MEMEKHMQTHNDKVQPLTLDSLLEMRKKLKTRLKARLDLTDADWLQDLYQRCNDSIVRARIDQSISRLRSDAK
jgi:hypothetical protein